MKSDQNKRKEAIALGYNENIDVAPKVLAKGKGIIAENIIEAARANDVPVQEDPSLVSLLSNLNINETIPEELYQVVAEVFAFIYKADRKMGKD